MRVTALRSGLTVTLRVPAAGKVSAVARVGRSVVARGSARAARAGALSLRLRAVAGQRKRLGRLRGRTMVVTITLGSRRIEVKRKLR